MIDAKRSFDKILKEYGHDILLQRRTTNDFQYSPNLERYTTRYYYPRTSSLMHSQEESIEGIASNSDLVYFFQSEVKPKPGDRIYENSEIPGEEAEIYLIDTSFPVRGRLGKIVYWAVGASKESPI